MISQPMLPICNPIVKTAPGYPEKYAINTSLLLESDSLTRIISRKTFPCNVYPLEKRYK